MLRSVVVGLAMPAFFFGSATAIAEPDKPLPIADQPAETASVPAQARRVHDGFYFSGSAGGGARSMLVQGSQTVTADGTGAAIGFRIGGALARNLFLHATLGSAVTEDPELSIGSSTVKAEGARLSFVSVGPGLTYYFMPANVSLGGSAVVMQTRLEFRDELLSKSEWGPGLEVRVGKDFWVSDDLLLGVGLTGLAGRMSDQNTTDTIEVQGFNLMLDFSYD
jgi:hypothetical protein